MRVIKQAFIDATATLIYIILVVSFIFSLQVFAPKGDIILIPIAMLLLFVFSAALTGSLVFGKPMMMYVDGKKKEAISLVAYTLLFLFIFTVLAFILLMVYFNLVV